MDIEESPAKEVKLETLHIKSEVLDSEDNPHSIKEEPPEPYIKDEIDFEEPRIHLNISKYKCDICDVTFTNEPSLEHHINENHLKDWKNASAQSGERTKKPARAKIFKCGYSNCGKCFEDHYRLLEHAVAHSELKPYKCQHTDCTKAFKTNKQLAMHIRLHSSEKPFTCNYEGCLKSFKTKSYLKLHLPKHTKERPFRCSYKGCEKSFSKKHDLKCHQSTHPTGFISKELVKCSFPDCKNTFPMRNSNYYKHIQKHKAGYRYRCRFEECAASFKKEELLECHVKMHLEDSSPTSSGVNTKIKEESAQSVEDSVEEKQKELELYACGFPNCGQNYNSIDQLYAHAKDHSIAKTFKCHFSGCRKFFKRKNEVKRHMAVHSSDKPYGCIHEGCQKSYKSKMNLEAHLRTHVDVTTFQCTFSGCGKLFKRQSYLDVHRKLHPVEKSAEKVIVCTFPGCKFEFRLKSTYNKHMKDMHSQEDSCNDKLTNADFGMTGESSREFESVKNESDLDGLNMGLCSELSGESCENHIQPCHESSAFQFVAVDDIKTNDVYDEVEPEFDM